MYDRLLGYVRELDNSRAVLMTGPRQVGKTVLLLQLADELLSLGWPPANITYFDFSDDRLATDITARDVFDLTPFGGSSERPRVFLLDEISKAARWGPWLKHAVDAKLGRFVVTDSAASLLVTETKESGQGRWDELRLEGLSFVEFLRLIGTEDEPPGNVFRRIPNTVERYLAVGGFPEHVLSEDFHRVRERLRSDIADRAIRRDLLRFGVDVERVKDLCVYLVQDSGAIFNARKRARDVGADERSVAQWVRLLEDSHLIVELQRHVGSATARLRSRPRIYASDHGLVAAFALSRSLEQDPGTRGRIVEASVFRHLREVADQKRGKLSFFRSDDNLEADFVLEYERERIVVEATASPNPLSGKFSRLCRVGDKLHTSRLVMIHGGIVEGGRRTVRSLSLARFLLNPLTVLQDKDE